MTSENQAAAAVRRFELAMELLTTGSISKEKFTEKYGRSVRTFQRDVKALRNTLQTTTRTRNWNLKAIPIV